MPEGKLAENNACEVETTGPGAKLHKKNHDKTILSFPLLCLKQQLTLQKQSTNLNKKLADLCFIESQQLLSAIKML